MPRHCLLDLGMGWFLWGTPLSLQHGSCFHNFIVISKKNNSYAFTVPVIRITISIIIIVVILVITIIIITIIIIIIIIIMIVRDTNSDQRRGESKTSCGGTSSMIFPQFKHLNHSFQVSKSLCESLVELGCNSKLLMFGRPGC